MSYHAWRQMVQEARPAQLGSDRTVAMGMAVLKLTLLLVAITEYDYFRDELYYLASTEHLDIGYVDHPPLSILLLAGWTAIVGDSLIALRLPPAVAGAVFVFITVQLSRRFGGGRFAQVVTGLATTFCGYLAIHHYYSMNALDPLVWAAAFWLLLDALETGSNRTWVALGAVLGLGLLNKISVLWLGAGIFIGLALTPQRRVLATRGSWMAAAVASILFSPYLVWQLRHEWPTLEFMANAARGKMVSVTPVEFFAGQAFFMNPLHLPIWALGLAMVLFAPGFRRWRVVAWIYLTVATILVAAGESKAFYLGPAYPPLLAAGAVTLERLLANRPTRWGRPVVVTVMLLGGIFLMPIALPVLPPETFIAYSTRLGLSPPPEERHEQGPLPQQYADQFGWREMAEAVARVYARLTPEERRRTVVFGRNYGEAGAIDLFGRRLGVPGAISGHNSYWFWGPGTGEADVVIIIGGRRESHLEFFDQVAQADIVRSRYAMPYENDLPIFVARNPKLSWSEAWPRLKSFS